MRVHSGTKEGIILDLKGVLTLWLGVLFKANRVSNKLSINFSLIKQKSTTCRELRSEKQGRSQYTNSGRRKKTKSLVLKRNSSRSRIHTRKT
jgi:hypothetical protein